MKNGGYDEIAIEDFHEIFLDTLKGLKDIQAEDAPYHCLTKMANNEDANYIIMYARFMAATHLKKNAILFENFVGEINQFCLTEVEQLDVECDHPQIMAITGYFNMGVEINSVSPNGGIELINLPEEGYSGFRPKLLYVPGHYDALYE